MLKFITRPNFIKHTQQFLFVLALLSASGLKASVTTADPAALNSRILPVTIGLNPDLKPGSVNYIASLLAPRIESFSPKHGHAGSRFKITGTNLNGLTSLKIGGTTAIVLSNNGTELVGMVTPKTRSGSISVITENGMAKSAGNFSITAAQTYSTAGAMHNSASTHGYEGSAVAVSGDGNTMVSGMPQTTSNIGGFVVYVNSGGTWSQQGGIVLPSPAVNYQLVGMSISISSDGNTVLAGTQGRTGSGGGASAFVFIRTGTTWTQQGAMLKPSDTVNTNIGNGFGQSVSLSSDGNTAAIGGQYDNNYAGAVWVFKRSAGVWSQQGSKLTVAGLPSNPEFGSSVAISGDGNTVFGGSSQDNGTIGGAWVFTQSGGVWAQQGVKLVGTGAVGNADQGSSLACSYDGNTFVIGGYSDASGVGSAWVFNRSGTTWTQNGTKLALTGIVNSSQSPLAGNTNEVAMSGDGTVLSVGSQGDNNGAGAFWVYALSGGAWTLHQSKFTSGTYFGTAVSLNYDGSILAVGASGYNNNNLGATFIYSVPVVTPTTQSTNLVFTNTLGTSTTASWTAGNGNLHAVFVSTATSGSPAPVNSTAYTAAAYGSGTTAGAGWYCVYNGTALTAPITGLAISTAYRVMVVDYNGPTGGQLYYTATATGNPASVTTQTPSISSTGTLTALSTTFGTASSTGTFNVSGQALSAGILVTAPTGFEVSATSTTGFSSAVTIGAAGTVASTPVYIRLAALSGVAASPYSGNVVLSSTGVTSVNVATVSSTVAKAALTLTANNVSKVYGATLTGASGSVAFTSTGLKNVDAISSVTIAYGTGAAGTVAVGTQTGVITPSLPVATSGTFSVSNYTITPALGNIIITQAPLTITATGPLKSYGVALAAATGGTNFTPVTGANSEAVTGLTLTPDAVGTSATSPVGSVYIITPSAATGAGGFLASNYNITYATYSGTVTKPALLITVLNQPKVYGTALVSGSTTNAASFSVSGTMASGESITGLTLTPDAVGLNATAAMPATYTVAGSLATGNFTASNYTISYTSYSGTETGYPLTVTATGPVKTYGTALSAGTSTLNYTASNPVGSEIVTGLTLTPDANGQSTTAAFNSAYVITPSAATGSAGFLASNYVITYVNYSGAIGLAPLTVTATGPVKPYGTVLGTTTGTTGFNPVTGMNSQAVSGITLTPNAAGVSGTTAVGAAYIITPSAATGTNGFAASNYNITYAPYNGTVTGAPITVTVTGPAKLYGTALTTGTTTLTSNFSVTGNMASGESITGLTLTPNAAGTTANSPATTAYQVVGTLATGTGTSSTFNAANYTITYVPFNSTVSQVPLTITATGQPKAYGTALTAGAITNAAWYTAFGTISGEAVTGVTLTPDVAGQTSGTAVGAAYVVTPSAATGSGAFLASNYLITYTPYSGTVTKAALAVTATGPSKLYGAALTTGTTTNTAFFTATGMAPGEAVTGMTLTPNAAGLSATTAAGLSYIVTPTAATGTGGFLAANYTITYNQYSGTVGQVPMTVLATGQTKTYGTALAAGTFSATYFTPTGMNSGETVTGVTLTPNAAGLAANTANGASYTETPSAATGAGGFLAANYAISYLPYTGVTGPAALTVTATGPAKAYGTALTATTGTTNFGASGAVTGESVTGITLSPDAAGQSTTTAKGANYVITPTAATGTGGFLASNYTVNYVPYTGIVSGNVLTITATGPGRVYGTALSTTTSTANFTVTGLISGDQVTGMTLTPDANGANASLAQGSAYAVTPSAPTGNSSFLASNYSVVYVPFNGTISPLNLTITATGPSKSYHTALSAASGSTSFTTSALYSGDLINSITVTPDAAGLSATTAAGAAYIIAPSAPVGNAHFAAANYAITYVNYTGAVTPTVLNITATGPAKAYGAVLATQTTTNTALFTATGMATGETVTGLTLTPNAAGTSATTASGAAFIITPSAATGTGGFLASNYTVNYLPFNGTVTPGLLTIAATGPLKKYGVALAAGSSTSSFTATGLATGETVTSVTLTPDAAGQSTTTANGAAYAVTPSAATGANGFLASNYTITYTPYSGTVGTTNLTITATSPNKKFGTALTSGSSAINFTTSGTLPGEAVTAVTLTADAAGLSATTATGTTYNVVPTAATGTGGFLASNYTITYVNYSGAVVAAPLSILATGPLKNYGTALASATTTTSFTASGIVNGDLVTGVTLSPDASGQATATAVGSTYLVTPSAATGNSSFLASNYAISYLPFTGTVSPITLTVTATGPNKPFGTGLAATTGSTNFTATGMASGETVTGMTLTPDAPGASATTAAGAHYVITPTAATGAGGFLAANYTITYVPYTGTVNSLNLLITATGTTKVYGQSLAQVVTTTNFTASGTVGSDVVTGITLTPNTAGTTANTAVGANFMMTPSLPTGNSSFIAANYNITYAGYTGTVTGAPLTVTATGPLKAYGVALATGTSTSSFTASGTISGEAVSSVTLTPDAAGISTSTAAGTAYHVAASAATGTGGFLASNYIITYNPYAGTVGTTTLTLTATAEPKTYGSVLTTAPGTNFTVTGTQPGQTVTSATMTPNTAGASGATLIGATYTVTPTAATGTGGFLAANYTITYVPYSGLVTPAALTITATGLPKAYGTALATTTTGATNFSTSGMFNGDVVNSLTLTPDAAGTSVTTAVGAAYSETPSAPTSTGSFSTSNYTITYVPYHGTVTAAAVTITATGPAKVFGQSLSATTGSTGYTATGMATGEQVTGVTLTPNAAGANATTAYNAAYTITPSAATGTGGFLASNYVMTYTPYTGAVSQAPLTLTATGPAKIYGTALAAATSTTNFTVTGMVNSDQVTGATLTPNTAGTTATTANGQNYNVVPSLATGNGSFVTSNYAITYVPFTGTVNPAPITVTATGPLKPFGTALAAATSTTNFTATAGVNGEAVTGVNLSPDAAGQAASTPKGSIYVIIPSAATGTGGFTASNYAVNYVSYTGTVGSTILTITATGPGRIYGTPLAATTGAANFSVSGLINGDEVTGMTLTPDANGATAGAATGATYVITPSAPTGNASFLASNYTVNYVPFSGTISALNLVIAATGPSKTYHTALTAGTSTTNFTATGLAAGETVSSVTLTPDAAGQSATTAAGTAYVVTPSAPAGNSAFLTSNYNITYTPYTGAVSTSVLTVTATGPSKYYGTVLATATTGSSFTAVGMVTGETVTGVTLTPNAAGASATTASGSAYMMTPSRATGAGGFLASNYTVNYLPYTGTVSAQPLTITATGPLKAYGVALAAGTSTSSFTSSGLATGETVTSVTLTPDAPGQSATTAVGAAYSVSPSAAAGAGGFLPANYSITYNPYNGTVGSSNLTITATSPNKTYGQALSSGTGTTGFIASGTNPGETVTGITLTVNSAGLSTSTPAGTTYSVTPTAATGTGGFLASNYTVTYVPYSGPVIAAPLSILATGPAKPYGTQLTAASSATNFTASGMMNGDQVTGMTLTPNAAGQAAATAVGSTYQVTPSAPTGNNSFLASNYAISYLPYNGTVSAINLTVTATGPYKPFGTPLATTASSGYFTASGMAGSETVTGMTLTPDAAGISTTTPSGAHYVVTPSAATGAGGFLASNYTINYVPYTGTVNALAMTITATGTIKVYGQALTAAATTSNFTTTGAVGGDAVTGITLSPDAAGQSVATVAGAGFVMTPSLPTGNSSFIAANYNITYVGFTGAVAAAPLTVNATGPLKKYGVALTTGTSTASFTAVGTIPGETVTSVTLTPNAAGLSSTTANGAPYAVAASAATGTGGFNPSNYTIIYGTYNGVVGTAALTITATGPAKSYGTALGTVSNGTAFTASGTFPGETVTTVTLTPNAAGASAATVAGSSYSVVPSAALGTNGFLASNYTVTYVPYTASVVPAALAITATGPLKSYGVVLAPVTGTLNFGSVGMVNGDQVTGMTLTPDAAGQSATTATGAAYVITPSAPTGNASFIPANYTITYNPYHGTVTTATVVITATGPAKIFGQSLSSSTGSTGYTATGMASGEAVTGVTLTPDAAGQSATTAYNVGYQITPSAATGTGGFLASNYTMIYNPYNGLVTKAPLTVIATGPSRIYGAVLAASTSTTNFTASGMTGADLVTGVTLTPDAAGQTANTPASSNYVIVPSLATGNSSFAAANYAITYIPFTGTVNPAALTVLASGPSKPFGTALTTGPGTTFTATGAISGEAVSSVTLTPDGAGQAANTPKGSSYVVTPSAATGTGGFNVSNYLVNYQAYTGTVSGTILTITATGPGRIFGTALTTQSSASNYTVSGLINGDLITGVTLTPDANGSTATAASGSAYTVTPSAATGNGSFLATNYTVNYVPYTGTISKLALAITATGPSKLYHTALSAGATTSNFTASGLASGDVVSGVTLTPDAAGLSATTAAGAAYVVTPSLPTGNSSFLTSNYAITYTPYTGAVGTSILTITATGPAKTYGKVLSAATSATNFTATGMVSGETVTALTLTPDAAGASATTAAGAAYTVTPSAATGTGGFLASNYTVSYIPFSGIVSTQALTINAVGPLKKYGVALTAGTSTSSFVTTGLATGETVTSVTLTPDAAGLSATTASGATYTVAASAATGAGGFLASNYTVTYGSYTGTVGNINLTITATSPNKTYGTGLTTVTAGTGFIVSGTQQGETVTGMTLTPDAAGQSATTAAGATYTMTPSGATGSGGFLASNYVVTYVPYSGPVIAAPLSILATGPVKVYGQALASTAATSFTASGAVGTDVVTGVTLTPDAAGQSLTAAAGSTYQVTPSAATGNAGFLTANYVISYLPYTGTVSPIALTVTATGPNKPFGTPLTAGTSSTNFTASGMATGETVTGIMLTPDAAGLAANTPTGTHYVMTPTLATGAGGFLASNYTVNYVPYTGTVNALNLTITATGTTKVYGTALAAVAGPLNYTVTGAVNGDMVSGITLTPDAAGASATTAVGTHFVMTPSLPTGNASFIAANYTITYIGFTGTVSAAVLNVTATGPLKKYGTALTAGSSSSNFIATGTLAGEAVTSVILTPDAAGLSAATASGAPYSVAASAAVGTGGFLASNYTVVYTTYSGVVGTTALTVTATNPAKSYGTALTTGASANGFITSGTFPGEQVTSVILTPNGAGASASTQTGSAFTVTPSGATGSGGFLAANYTITYMPYSGIVTPAILSVTATGPSKAYGVALTAGVSTTNFGAVGLVNGDAVSSVTLTPDAAGLSAATPSGAGYVVTPSAPTGNAAFLTSNYTITYIPYYGTVVVTPLTITATGPNKTYGTALTVGASTLNFTVTGVLPGQAVTGLTLTPDATGLSTSAAAGSAYTVQPSLPTGTGGFQAANYTIVYVGFNGTVAKRALNITAAGLDKVYNNSTAATVTLADDRVTGDLFTTSYNSASFADKNAGTGKVVTASGISISGAAAANYTIASTVTTTATITSAPAILTAQAATKVYNKTVASIVLPVITGLIGTDATGVILSQTYDTYNVGAGKTLTPAAVINDGNSGFNYAVSPVSSSLGEITSAPVIVTAVAATKVYDNTTSSAYVPVVTGLFSTDAASKAPVQTYDTPSVGTGKTLTPAGLIINDGNGGANYTVTYQGATSGIITGSADQSQSYLANLTTSSGVLSPVFAEGTATYKVLVLNTVSSITVTPTAAESISSIMVNGFAVASGSASQPISLTSGVNTIVTKVTALDGTTVSTYTLIVTRGGRTDANLTNLVTSTFDLDPGFDTNTINYAVAVDNSIFYTKVTPVVEDAAATVTVNGFAVNSGASIPVTLYIGGNIITTVVTAQDGITTKTYTAIITRATAPLKVIGDNILTPNGDGVNDLWVITGIKSYPKNVVTVYDRTGRIVFTEKTYDNTWNGTYRGSVLPEDTYYFTIDLGDGSKTSRGFITLLHDHK